MGRQVAKTKSGKASEPPVRPAKAGPPPWLVSALIAIGTILVFVPATHNDFVNYDDSDYVTSNAHVQEGLTWASIKWAFSTGHASNWHPLTWISHMIDWQMFGAQPAWHHVVSVLIHAANAALLFIFLHKVTGRMARSAWVAVFFAIHPLHVESVAWLAERKDVLSGFFFMLTLLCYAQYALKYEVDGSGRGATAATVVGSASASSRRPLHGVAMWFCLSLAAFACGLMSKPMLVTVPFVLLLMDYWPLNRWRTWRSVLEKIPFFALAIASSVVTYLVQRRGGAVSAALTFSQRIANAFVSYCRYIGKTFVPIRLAVLYPHPGSWPLLVVILATLAIVLITAAVLFARRRAPYLLIGWFWFLGMLVPAIGIVQVGVQAMADRYSYLPLIGVFIIVVWGAGDLFERATTGRFILPALGAAAVIGCIILASVQIGYWRNSETLFRHAVAVTSGNYLAYNNLGYYLSNRGKVIEAMEDYSKALAINPIYEDAQNNLGFALAGQKKYAEAIEHYNAALAIKPMHVEVHNNLGNALADLGRIDEAIQHYLLVLNQNPSHADAHNNLGIALAMKGRVDEAIPHFEAAIRSKPGYASAHSNLGNALALRKDWAGAIREYQACLAANPKDSQAHNNLGNAYVELNHVDDAIAQYQQALALNPDNPETNYNLALALLHQGHLEEAKSHLQKALQQRPDYPEAKHQLELITSAPAPLLQ